MSAVADYKRVISYLYNYQNKVKTNNVGFVRLEVRDGMCKMTIHLRVPLLKVEEMPIYGYTIKNDSITAVPIGNMRLQDGVGDCKITTPADNIKNSMYSIQDIEGILLYISDIHYFAAHWEDDAVIFEEFIVRQQKEESTPMLNASELTGTPYVATPREENAEESSMKKEVDQEKLQEQSLPSKKPKEEIKEEEIKEEKVREEEKKEGNLEEQSIENEILSNSQDRKEELEEQSLEEAEIEHQDQEKRESIEEQKREQRTEGMDQQAQEFFDKIMQASAILGMFQKENNIPSQESEDALEMDTLQKMAEAMSIPEQSEIQEQAEVNPEAPMECVKEFQTCESQQDYQEIQAHIQSLQAQTLHLEHVCDQWLEKVKKEEELEHQRLLQKQSYENQIREEIQLDPELFQPKEEMEQKSIDYGNGIKTSTVVSRIFEKYPKITPFSPGVVEDCIKIAPQDIGIFPMENWILANNSFLLHGYYSYRHLVFIKRRTGETCEYLLGVPGVNHNREQFMAKMFGFNQFQCVTGQEPCTGDFGYWCMNINM